MSQDLFDADRNLQTEFLILLVDNRWSKWSQNEVPIVETSFCVKRGRGDLSAVIACVTYVTAAAAASTVLYVDKQVKSIVQIHI